MVSIRFAAAPSGGTVKSHQKTSDTEGNFGGILADGDHFGCGVANLGGLEGDGVSDMFVRARLSDDEGLDGRSIWILLMNVDRTVKAEQKTSDTVGGFSGILDDDDRFGGSITNLGDLAGDEVPDLVVSAIFDDDGGTDRGAVWVLFMKADHMVKSHQEISQTEGSFTGTLDDDDRFGVMVASPGDLMATASRIWPLALIGMMTGA